MSEDVKGIKDKIWITSKVRMVAEYKRRNTNNILWVIGLWYSFASLVIHLLAIYIKIGAMRSLGLYFI